MVFAYDIDHVSYDLWQLWAISWKQHQVFVVGLYGLIVGMKIATSCSRFKNRQDDDTQITEHNPSDAWKRVRTDGCPLRG